MQRFTVKFLSVISLLWLGKQSQGNHELDAICSERFDKQMYLKPSDCKQPTYWFPNAINGCFPDCIELKNDLTTTQVCRDGIQSHSNNICPPGYRCEGTIDHPPLCIIVENSCFKYTTLYPDPNNKYKSAMWKPRCMDDGTWAPKQCKGEASNGRCFCFDELGHRLPGQQFSTRAENMTCACSRTKAELIKDPNNWHVSLHCDDEGNFEPLQCNQGQCWCVLPQTGQVVSKIVPESMWTRLPCYDRQLNGETYMRQCESHQFAQIKLQRYLSLHGTTDFQMQTLVCDGDGSYGPYSINDNVATCVWKDNKPLGPWHVAVNEKNPLSRINCNCARDKKVYENAGLKLSLHCDDNGNYHPLQSTIIKGKTWYFCVDADGFQNSAMTKKPAQC